MKANIAKKVLICTLSAALLAAPCAGVSAAGTGAGTKAVSSGSSITAEVEEIVTANAWVGSDDNSGSGSSVTVAQVPVTSSVGGVKSSLPGVYLATSVRGTAITSSLTSIADNYGLQHGQQEESSCAGMHRRCGCSYGSGYRPGHQCGDRQDGIRQVQPASGRRG